jgi:hypothetical protein
MKRGVWNDRASKTALGMVDFLSRANPRALAGLMDELRRFADQDNRRTNADGTWTRSREYEVPLERQKAFLERYFGPKVFSAAIAHWTSGAPPPK